MRVISTAIWAKASAPPSKPRWPHPAVNGDTWLGQAVALLVIYRWYAPRQRKNMM
ncbi:MAG: hypothetical protein R2911_07290 [Caldilineaceae bacterium]